MWEKAAGAPTRRPVLVISQHAVHPNRFHAARGSHGIRETRFVAHVHWVKENEVCSVALFDLAAVAQSKSLGRQAGHFANGFLQGEESFVATVVSQHTREGSPQSRMRKNVIWQAVGPDHGGWIRENRAHVLFCHTVVDGAGRLQPSGSFKLADSPGPGDR